ncbi:hypothetical protein J8273_6172 [Carpediemonas membranifera]|uniref:Uncharacterized protein n=1 Tax=Carpediemonas membranifera TaxID=201153 RepID=A0A8J6B281_9EUKA|nr:hypothetical protein J8273_6172 [Carpediemonas membranifera]|eukprot:KAG9391412.1 hypothetical protein J8273_6172 [Carpediemonas membranifera]
MESDLCARLTPETVLSALAILLTESKHLSTRTVYPAGVAKAISYAMRRFSILIDDDWTILPFHALARVATMVSRVDSAFPSVLLANIYTSITPDQVGAMVSMCPVISPTVAPYLLSLGVPNSLFRLCVNSLAHSMHTVDPDTLAIALMDVPDDAVLDILSHDEASAAEDKILDISLAVGRLRGLSPSKMQVMVRDAVRLPQLSSEALSKLAETGLVTVDDLICAAKCQAIPDRPAPYGLNWARRTPKPTLIDTLRVPAALIYGPGGAGRANRMVDHLIASGAPQVVCVPSSTTDEDDYDLVESAPLVIVMTKATPPNLADRISRRKRLTIYTAIAVPRGSSMASTPASTARLVKTLTSRVGIKSPIEIITSPLHGPSYLAYSDGTPALVSSSDRRTAIWNLSLPAEPSGGEFEAVMTSWRAILRICTDHAAL